MFVATCWIVLLRFCSLSLSCYFQVLYDQNDFDEVLRKTDKTMASVTNLFHDSVTRKSGKFYDKLLTFIVNCLF